MNNEELVELYLKAVEDAADETAKFILNELVVKNKRFVPWFASKFYSMMQNNIFDVDDLIQEGWIAFIKAVKKYDSSKGFKFISYAGANVRFAMLNFINRKGIEREYKYDLQSMQMWLVSLDSLVGGLDNITMDEVIPDAESMRQFEQVDAEMDNDILRWDLLNVLDAVFGGEYFSGEAPAMDEPTMKNVVLLHYGLYGKPMSFTDIGNEFGLSAQRMQQKQNQAMWSIIHSPAGDWLRDKYCCLITEELKAKKAYPTYFKEKDVAVAVCKMETIDDSLKRVALVESIDDMLNSILGAG
ncbi:sigma-70 family RNA polymerase sigma factor [Anaeroarcus burkinensis]|uniref:sigma-70 family RNA polymerase sigma factor n=1 Tax=Anaeroarcus burkinensis TaxID=82376 RepID=UPI0004871689|nr:sigma-70 family RNA polymerase sigma factor [Anaeroarcus burkinensis]